MSLPIDSCFTNIIGLSETDCNCFNSGKPIDANVSLSGLMLDQLEGLNLRMASSAENCEGSLWELMDKARRNAIYQFKGDILAELQKKYVLKRPPFLGAIGKTGYRNSLTINSTYAGASIFCAPMRGGTFRLKRIGSCFEATGTFTLTLYNNLQDAALQSWTINTTANQVNWNTITTVDLPMADEGGASIQYYFIYSLADSGRPKDNSAACGGCGERHYWNISNPKFTPAKNKWSEYVMFSGTNGNHVSNNVQRDSLSCGSSYSNGLIFDAEFLCDFTGLICSTITDFDNNPTAIVVAGSIRYLAGAFLIDYILASGNIDYFTMSDGERLIKKKDTYLKEYLYRVTEALPQSINIDVNDCLVCDNEHAPRLVGIRS
jgi:hypothetical protein